MKESETLEIVGREGFRDTRVVVHEREQMTLKARLAVQMVERWGLVAAVPDGEDGAGRQKMRVPTPAELVGQACSVASALVDEFRRSGWMVEVPGIEEMERAAAEHRKQNREGN